MDSGNGHDPDATEGLANELYWSSDESVNHIAEELGLSKGALYQLVHPQDAGLVCPRCGGRLEFPNRTARDRGFVTCAACDWEGSTDAEEVEARGRALVTGHGIAADRTVLGVALLGVAAGVIVAWWLRRR